MKRKAILAAIDLGVVENFDKKLEECVNLCDACEIEVVATVTQSARSLDKNTGFRKGKMDELKEIVEENEVDLIVFYNHISLYIQSNISTYCECEVLDRTTLILDIFALRARTKEAMIQTEMARLEYHLPKMLKDYNDNERQRGGGVYNKGAGELKSDLVKRKMEDRIAELRKELEHIEGERIQKANKRRKSNLKKLALVGYTNAGKSSFMNCLLGMNEKDEKVVFEKDMLFATLDTSIRNIKYKNYEFLLFDTVGFVSDLPHQLINAFHSTLSAALEADVLLNIIDASDKDCELHKQVTMDTLKEIGVSEEVPVIDVYNKIDLLEEAHQYEYAVSTKTKEGMEHLLDHAVELLYPKDLEMTCLLPYNKMGMISDFQNKTVLEIIDYKDEGVLIKVAGPKQLLQNFEAYEIAE